MTGDHALPDDLRDLATDLARALLGRRGEAATTDLTRVPAPRRGEQTGTAREGNA